MGMEKSDNQKGILQSLDWWTIGIYLALLAFGWVSVCGASYTYGDTEIFSLSTRSGMQIVWIGTSICLGFVILMLDDRYFDTFAYVIFGLLVLLLFATIFNPHEIKGSRSWLVLGSLRLQPAEFAKFATALAISKLMSTYGFDIHNLKHFAAACGIILVPMICIVGQRETGSALVYLSFFLMLYREGMPGGFLFTGVAMIIYFVIGIKFEQSMLFDTPTSVGKFSVLLLVQLFSSGMVYAYNGDRPHALRLLGLCLGVTVLAFLFSEFVIPFDIVWVQLILSALLIGYLIYNALRTRFITYLYAALFALGSIAFFYSADYVLNDVMQPHQRVRINVLLELDDDLAGARLQRSSERDSHRIGRIARQRFPQRYTDKAEICSRAGHRFHLLYGRRRGGIPRFGCRPSAFPRPHHPSNEDCGTTTIQVRTCLWLLRGQCLPLPRVHQRRHGARTDPSHRHPPTLLQLRRFLALGIHHPPFHLPAH